MKPPHPRRISPSSFTGGLARNVFVPRVLYCTVHQRRLFSSYAVTIHRCLHLPSNPTCAADP
eukprot:1190556-Prorocentrum_minimum.AAC.1